MQTKLAVVFIVHVHLIFIISTSVCLNISLDHAKADDLHGKIIGGQLDRVAKYPHAVYLLINKIRICGGSILRDRLILTAAHCFHEIEPTRPVVAYIGHENPDRALQVIRAKKWIKHKHFDMSTIKYDICLILLRDKIRLGSVTKKILLIQKQPTVGMEAYTAGWGDTVMTRSGRQFKSVKQIVRKTSECRKIFSEMDRSQICAGFYSNNNMVYSGDSGSALVVNGSVQVGIVSCGRPFRSGYTVYVSVYYFKNWIADTARILIPDEKKSAFNFS